ncbi:hypothetical protein BABINDRAFT_161740 [Babjeviella inositovora NRRL Y-12698]|uniref:Uncharacterized protein n=1 Tax=Babjeviella inositovora NRRL Y-12698 TaxID=984486 RepID=A0A1E3QNV6_9ASCO|nr:uncharacterized protein BABINDRAFT_161740 [Babjeviella inositovora NRRL Y-12698]ODQ79330.1 hypothetical protein BABINDRAFT_161740 [Babjeviella inositovora NRRL Y-12698]
MATEWIRRASLVLARRPSTFELFANNQKLDVRAHQRTYEGAYIRSSIGALSFCKYTHSPVVCVY